MTWPAASMNANVPAEGPGYGNPHKDTRNHSAVPTDVYTYIEQVIFKIGTCGTLIKLSKLFKKKCQTDRVII